MDEPQLIRFFIDLTGEPEGAARSVLIYLDILERDYFPSASRMAAGSPLNEQFLAAD